MIQIPEHQAAQGDVLFRRIDRVPQDARRIERRGPIVVAHSETGHHHAIDDTGVMLYEPADPLVCYLHITGEWADVVHQRPFDAHATIRLRCGVWEARRQREHTPEGWRRVED